MRTILILLLLGACTAAPLSSDPSDSVWLGGPTAACQAHVGADGQVGC